MKIGAHVSIAGGITNAPQRAEGFGCEVFQLFTRSPRGGPAPVLTSEIVKNFKSEMKKWNQENCYIHTPYYINFASANKSIRDVSARIVREELDRGSLIGAKYVMTHLGSSTSLTASSTKDPEIEALKLVASGIRAVMKGYEGSTQFLLEISAGAGNVIGDTFEELHQILEYIKSRSVMIYHNIGICLDSAHMFAGGYDIKTENGMKEVMKIIRKTVGMERIKLIHSNDSKIDLGGRRDRHDHVGDGKIGEEGFVNLMKTFPDVDFVLETEHDKVKEDIQKLKNIRDRL